MSQSFALLVPVKTLTRAKSRLGDHASRDAAGRAALMRAFALDAIGAAGASPLVSRVYVVSDEAALLDGLERTGSTSRLADHGDGDLNRALSQAALSVRLADPGTPVAALLADLPSLRTDDLTTALAAGQSPRWYVADAAGSGTTLLAAGPGVELDPHFGPDSAARHERSGAVPVRAEVPTLRRDVDTDEDLEAALGLGVGSRTAAVLDLPRRTAG